MSIFRPSRGPSPFSWIAKLHGEGKLPLAKPAPEIIEETPAEAAARRAAEFATLTGTPPVTTLAAKIIEAGARARGELADEVPRDAAGKPLDNNSLAYKIVQAARKARL